uniref:Uncharacterized protein n=1 Tax=Thermogemmatispora argillosa TaxID=2045280 RepID=A0A455SYT3_9CHLR|nr:hypothetical protein KTA_05100 [Thermogemmatispora argillosa]
MLASPQEQTRQPLPVPPDVEQAARSADLGLPQKHYRPSILVGLEDFLIMPEIALYLSLGYLIVAIILRHNNILELLYEYFIILLLMAGFLLILGFPFFLLALFLYLFRGSWGVYVYERGFIYKRGRRVKAWLWDQIMAVWQEVSKETRMISAGDSLIEYSKTNRFYILQIKDSKNFIFDIKLAKMQELIDFLDERIKNRLLPQVIAAFEAGETVTFGALRLNREGVSWKDKTILWVEIRAMTLTDTTLIIEKTDKKKAYWDLSPMPNISLFRSLKDHIFQRYLGITEPGS